MTIAVLVGTLREGRRTIHAAKFVHKQLSKREGIKSVLVDPKDFSFPGDGNDDSVKDPRYTEIVEKVDGFFIVTPEYNHSIPGSLKRMLDSELSHYIHKPVAFAGVSAGPWGGIRAIESAIPMVREMGMVATFTDVQFPLVQNVFDSKGNLQEDAYIKRVDRAIDELLWMTQTLAHGRENIPSSFH